MPNKTALKQGAFVLPEVCGSCGGYFTLFREFENAQPPEYIYSTSKPQISPLPQNVIENVIVKTPVLQHFSADHVDHKNTNLAAETSPKLLYINRYDDDPVIALKNYNKKYKNQLTNKVKKRIIDNRKGT